jgi:hypothetical protein
VRATVVDAAGAARIETVPAARLTEPADAALRVTRGEGHKPPPRLAIWATGRLPGALTRRAPRVHRRRPGDPQPGTVITGRIGSGLDVVADAGGAFQVSIDGLNCPPHLTDKEAP